MIPKESESLDPKRAKRENSKVPLFLLFFVSITKKKKRYFIFCYFAGGKSLEKLYFITVHVQAGLSQII